MVSTMEQCPLTQCNMEQTPSASFWNQYYTVNGKKEDLGENAVLCWLRFDFWWVWVFFKFSGFHFEMRQLSLSAVPSSQLAFSSVKNDAVLFYLYL